MTSPRAAGVADVASAVLIATKARSEARPNGIEPTAATAMWAPMMRPTPVGLAPRAAA